MTEDEARTKQCPWHVVNMTNLAIALGNAGAPDDAITKTGATHYCRASDCMMWRYIDYEYVKPEGVPPNNRSTLEGYCGLAGKQKREQ